MERGAFGLASVVVCCLLPKKAPKPETLQKTHPETNDIIRFLKFHKMETIILHKVWVFLEPSKIWKISFITGIIYI